MCGPLAILASAGSTMIQMSAQQKQAEATAKNERRVAMQQKIDREMGKVQALQRQNQRVEEYISAEKSNMAVFSASGVDVDSASQKAFEEANAVTVGEDVRAIAFQADMQARTRTVQAGIAEQRAMVGTGLSGIYNMASVAPANNSLSEGFKFLTTPFDLS